MIRLELNREQAEDSPESNRYTRAARFLKEWTRDGVLREDSQPSYYLYHQTFEVEGQTLHPQGVPRTRATGTVRLRATSFRTSKRLPDPRPTASPLFHATKYNLSPIFGLYPDDDQLR